jgi:hypothetical protein
MRPRPGILALALTGCTPTGEVDKAPPPFEDEDDDDVVDVGPITSISVPARPSLTLSWPGCEQTYPPPNERDSPFVWQSPEGEGDHPCRHGCTSTRKAPSSAAPGIDVALAADHGVRIAASTWHRHLPADGLAAEFVQWTSWCGTEIVLALHDRKNLRLVALDSATGNVVETIEQPIDRVDDDSFALQMHCREGRTAVHARGRTGAWSMHLPSAGHPAKAVPTRVPDEIWADIQARPHGTEHAGSERDESSTATRRYHRKGNELFAFDRDGLPLWHRTAVDAWIGCLQGGQLMGLVGCSRCPTRTAASRMVGESVVLESHSIRSSTDVFDADGTHLVHLSR